ncbi:MAG: SDR family oxidoreductase [Planctomycetes bacterium]|nr:SDR family oxidoreductase [Planctomycetota bacterium]
MKPFQLRGSVVLVTGASSGIGNDTAVALEKSGARVAMAARRIDRLQELRATFQFPGEHLPIRMDVTDPKSVESAFREIDAKFGKLDGIVANAGVGGWYPVHEVSEDEMRRTIETNVYGVVRCIRAGVPLLRKAGGGTIVLVSSVVGRRGVPGMGIYSASKFALHGLADAARIELARENISVSVICPGLTHSEFHQSATGDKGASPPKGEGEPSEAVARAIIELLQSGKPEVHRMGALHPKRWAGVITQIFPKLMDRQLEKYYARRKTESGSR